MNKQLHVGIIFGGNSTEHAISLKSAKNIFNEIDRNKFDVFLIGIDKKGKWWYLKDAENLFLNNNLKDISLDFSREGVAIISNLEDGKLIDAKNAKVLIHVDVIFPIVHGTFGEDGSLQGLLKIADVPFVGSNVLSSSSCMDKDVSRRLLRDAGLNVAPSITLSYTDEYRFSDFTHLGLPLFIKPVNQGSSVGISKVNNEMQFNEAVHLAFKFSHKIIVESSIQGREIECAILGNCLPQVSVCGEIIYDKNFYSYRAKYAKKKIAKIIIPANLSSKMNNMIRKTAVIAYQVLGCQGMARIDFFLTQKNKIIINEINTLPGFTEFSMYPRLWEASGLSYSELISRLIELALYQYSADRSLKKSINDYLSLTL